MGRMNDEHRMELEPHRRAGLNVANPRQQERSKHLPIRKALPDPRADFFEQTLARSLLDHADQSLDGWVEANVGRKEPCLGGEDGRESGKESKL